MVEMKRQEMLTQLDAASSRAPVDRLGASRFELWLKHLREGGWRYLNYVSARCGFWSGREIEAETFWGRKLKLPLNDNLSWGLYCWGLLGNPEERRLARFLIKALRPGDVFYDIGAHHGFYSWLALELVRGGEVHAFEPIPDLFARLKANARDEARLTLNNAALSDCAGTLDFYLGKGHLSSLSTLVGGVAAADAGRFQRIKVRAATLDDYAADHRPPTIMKWDVEGAERQVIDGGRNLLRSSSPVIAMEIWAGEEGQRFSKAAGRELEALGYVPHRIGEAGDLLSAQGDYVPGIGTDNVVWLRK